MPGWIAAILSLAAGAAWAQSYTWTDITPANGLIRDVATDVFDGKRLIVTGTFQPGGTASSPFYFVMYSNDAGRSWNLPVTPLPGPPVSVFADVAQPGVVYLEFASAFFNISFGAPAHTGSLQRSADFGRTWSAVRLIAIGETVHPFATDPIATHGLYAFYQESYQVFASPGVGIDTRNYATIRSHDDGFDWTTPLAAPSANSMSLVGPTPSSPTRLFMSLAGGGTAISLDSGATWTPFGTSSGLPGLQWIRPDPLRSSLLYAELTFPSVSPGIFYSYLVRSDDGGASWTTISYASVAFNHLTIDPARPNIVWISGNGTSFYRSQDRGDTWREVAFGPPGATQGLITSPSEPGVVYVVRASRLFRGTPSYLPEPLVVEYEYEGNRYWLTSLDGEAVSQDNRQQPGNVHRTGERWGAWLAGDAPAGAVGSCRFWGKPESGLRTRVLVLQGFECEAIKRDLSWILEAENEFYAVPPRGDGCPDGLVPVRRFNNLNPDLNHRWVVDGVIAAEMRARGWYDEGVRFCARPLGPNE